MNRRAGVVVDVIGQGYKRTGFLQSVCASRGQSAWAFSRKHTFRDFSTSALRPPEALKSHCTPP